MLSAETRLRDFPSLTDMVYLYTAAEGIPPRAVGDALQEYFRDKLLGHDGRERHFAQWEAARELVGEAFGLSADEVSICSCSSEAFNWAALALGLRSGDEVVINDLDFPSGATPDTCVRIRFTSWHMPAVCAWPCTGTTRGKMSMLSLARSPRHSTASRALTRERCKSVNTRNPTERR